MEKMKDEMAEDKKRLLSLERQFANEKQLFSARAQELKELKD